MRATKKAKNGLWLILSVLFIMFLSFCIGAARQEANMAFAAAAPKYTALGSVRSVSNQGYGAAFDKTQDYTTNGFFANCFAVEIYGSTSSGSAVLSQNAVLNLSPVTIAATVKTNKNPHNQNFPYGHKSYSVKNNTTGATVKSGSLSGTGTATLLSQALPDGRYTVTYTVGGTKTGFGGGTITDTFTFSFYIDRTPPAQSLKAGGANIASGGYTNSLITYTASDTRFSKLYYKKPSASSYASTTATSYAVSATAANNGLWSFYAEDTVGNASSVVTVYLDTVAPVGKITSNGIFAESGGYTNKSFSFAATDGGGIAEYEYKTPSSSAWKTYTAGQTIPITATNGWYYFRAVDRAGQSSKEYAIYLDTGKPFGTLYAEETEASDGSSVEAKYISFTGTDAQSGIKTVYVKKPGAGSFIETANGSQFAVEGTYSFYCVDKAGTESDVYTLTLLPEAAPEAQIVRSDSDTGVCITWLGDHAGTINGKPYTKNTWIYEEGSYTFVLTSKSGKSSTYNFDIDCHYVAVGVVSPTCTEPGYSVNECTWCKDRFNDNYIEATGHSYREEIVQTPSCTKDGVIRFTCSVCKDTYEIKGDEATGHTFVETATPATCTESGKRIYSCQICGYEYTLDGEPAAGHIYTSTILKNATCLETGERQHICERCEFSYISEIPSLGHQYVISDVEAEDGHTVRTYTCTVCGDSYTQDLGNQYEEVSNYIEYLFNLYSPYMIWVFLATAGVWSIIIGAAIIIAHKNEDKEKAKRMLVNYVIGLIVIFGLLVVCPFLVRGIAVLVA